MEAVLNDLRNAAIADGYGSPSSQVATSGQVETTKSKPEKSFSVEVSDCVSEAADSVRSCGSSSKKSVKSIVANVKAKLRETKIKSDLRIKKKITVDNSEASARGSHISSRQSFIFAEKQHLLGSGFGAV